MKRTQKKLFFPLFIALVGLISGVIAFVPNPKPAQAATCSMTVTQGGNGSHIDVSISWVFPNSELNGGPVQWAVYFGDGGAQGNPSQAPGPGNAGPMGHDYAVPNTYTIQYDIQAQANTSFQCHATATRTWSYTCSGLTCSGPVTKGPQQTTCGTDAREYRCDPSGLNTGSFTYDGNSCAACTGPPPPPAPPGPSPSPTPTGTLCTGGSTCANNDGSVTGNDGDVVCGNNGSQYVCHPGGWVPNGLACAACSATPPGPNPPPPPNPPSGSDTILCKGPADATYVNGCTVRYGQTVLINIVWATMARCYEGRGPTSPPGTSWDDGQVFGGITTGNKTYTYPNMTANTNFYVTCDDGSNNWVTNTVFVTVIPPQPAIGYLDAANCNIIGGWAFDPDDSSTSVPVHMYKDGPAGGGGSYVDQAVTTGLRPDVNLAYSISGFHGFTWTTPDSLKDGLTHTIWIHPIDVGGTGPNSAIGNSGITLGPCSNATTPVLNNITISAPKVLADNLTDYVITNTSTDPGGAGKIVYQYALTNLQTNSSQPRGYLLWYGGAQPWPGINVDDQPCAGKGRAEMYNAGYGNNVYMDLVSCSVSVSGNTQSVAFTVRFKNQFNIDGPWSNNHISGLVYNSDGNFNVANWTDFIGFDLITTPAVNNLTINTSPVVADNSTNYTLTLTVSDPGGTGKILYAHPAVNISTAQPRAYMLWYQGGNPWPVNSVDDQPCGGGGRAEMFIPANGGNTYMDIVGCSISDTNSTTRVITFNVKFKPQFLTDGPLTGNELDGYVSNTDGKAAGWIPFGSFDLVTTPSMISALINSPTVNTAANGTYFITVTGRDPGGANKITHEYAWINFITNTPQYRGFLTMYYPSDYWSTVPTTNKDDHACAGGGWASVQLGGSGESYIHLDSCTVTNTDALTRVTTFAVRFDPTFTTPGTGNRIAGYVYNANGKDDGWRDSGSFDLDNPPTPPTITAVTPLSGANCGKMKIDWNDVAGEDGYTVWRTTTSGSGYVNISGTLAANTTTYTDNGPLVANTIYYYVVHATKAGNPDTVSTEANALSPQCLANFTTSAKSISLVNGAVYTNATPIKTGDTVTFQVILRNVGNTSATVNYICDTPSTNFTTLRNLAVSGAGSSGGTAGNLSKNTANCSGANNYELNISGAKAGANPDVTPWTITYNATFNSTGGGGVELCQNTATVNYTDSANNNQPVKFGPRFCNNTGNNGAAGFKEVAP